MAAPDPGGATWKSRSARWCSSRRSRSRRRCSCAPSAVWWRSRSSCSRSSSACCSDRPSSAGSFPTTSCRSSRSSGSRCSSSSPATRSTSRTIRGRPITRAAIGWIISLAAAFGIAVTFAAHAAAAVFIAIALTSTALGTIMPVLRDSGDLKTPFGVAVIALGAVGEFGPLLAISIFLGGRSPLVATIVLLAFALVAARRHLVRRARRRPATAPDHQRDAAHQRPVRRTTRRARARRARRAEPGARSRHAARRVHRRGALPAAPLGRAGARRRDHRGQGRGARLRIPRADLLHLHRCDVRPRGPLRRSVDARPAGPSAS